MLNPVFTKLPSPSTQHSLFAEGSAKPITIAVPKWVNGKGLISPPDLGLPGFKTVLNGKVRRLQRFLSIPLLSREPLMSGEATALRIACSGKSQDSLQGYFGSYLKSAKVGRGTCPLPHRP